MMNRLRSLFRKKPNLALDTQVKAQEAQRLVERIQEQRKSLSGDSDSGFPFSGFIRDIPPRGRRVRSSHNG